MHKEHESANLCFIFKRIMAVLGIKPSTLCLHACITNVLGWNHFEKYIFSVLCVCEFEKKTKYYIFLQCWFDLHAGGFMVLYSRSSHNYNDKWCCFFFHFSYLSFSQEFSPIQCIIIIVVVVTSKWFKGAVLSFLLFWSTIIIILFCLLSTPTRIPECECQCLTQIRPNVGSLSLDLDCQWHRVSLSFVLSNEITNIFEIQNINAMPNHDLVLFMFFLFPKIKVLLYVDIE